MKILASLPIAQAHTARPCKQQQFGRIGIAIAAATLPLIGLATPSFAVLTEYLRLGTSGSQVFELQERLNRLGYRVRIDGSFGSDTRDAVFAYQRACGLSVDGIVGSDTRAKLNRGDRCGGGGDFNPDPGNGDSGNDYSEGDRRWVVLVPTDDPETLTKVRRYNRRAFVNYSGRFGPYIQVGVYDDKYRAESVYRRLQKSYGVRDAHMRYQPI